MNSVCTPYHSDIPLGWLSSEGGAWCDVVNETSHEALERFYMFLQKDQEVHLLKLTAWILPEAFAFSGFIRLFLQKLACPFLRNISAH